MKVESDQLKAELKRLDQNISSNKKTAEFIENMKLVVRIPDGSEMCVTRNDIVGY